MAKYRVPDEIRHMLGLGGRPREWDPDEWIPVVLDWCSSGRMLSEFTDRDDTPGWNTVYGWRKSVDGFREALEAAREEGRDRMAEDVIAIADGKNWEPFADPEHRTNVRIRMLGRWSHRFAEKRQVEQTGSSTVQIVTGVPDPEPTKSKLLE